jgi:hypothetical protein
MDKRYARLIGFVGKDEIEYIENIINSHEHIEWKKDGGEKRTYYIYLTKDEYDKQMQFPNRTWCCPKTGLGDRFDDKYFESQNI